MTTHPKLITRSPATIYLAFAVCSVVALSVHSADDRPNRPVIVDFDDSVPGDLPKPWTKSWGDRGHDAFEVTNLAAVSQRNSMLLARRGDPAHWGAAMPMPAITSGRVHLTFALRIEGSGVDARFHFEVRADPAARQMYSFGFGNRFGERLAVFRNEASGQSLKLGEYEPGKWYLVQAWLPTVHGESDIAAARLLERSDEEESWVARGPGQALPGVRPDRQYNRFMVSTHPGERKFRLYLDDIRITGTPSRPADDTNSH